MIKFLFIFYLLISPFLVHASHCHPLINKFKKQYIIGYGSLISESSKKNTYLNTGVNIPVEVSGYKRSFCVQNYFNKTYPNAVFLGVQKNKSEKFNGVIFKIIPNSIKNFDLREKGYCRELVSASNIKPLINSQLDDGQYWIYLPPKKLIVKTNNPFVLKYYKKLFFKGCMDIEKKYKIKNYYKNCFK